MGALSLPPHRLRHGALLLALGVCGGACDSSAIDPMERQPYARAYAASSFFANGAAMRPLVPGVVPTSRPPLSTLTTGRDSRGGLAEQLPVPLTRELLERGQERYEITCAPCHGLRGDGHSVVGSKMSLRPPPSLLDHLVVLGPPAEPEAEPPPRYQPELTAEQIRHRRELHQARLPRDGRYRHPPGYLFQVITGGYGLMPGYASQLSPRDRWAIIAYLEALQLAEEAPLELVPAAQRPQLGRRR